MYISRYQISIDEIMLEEIGFVGIKILLSLYRSDEEKMYIRELMREAGIGGTSTYRALAVLADFGLVRLKRKYRMKFIFLTDSGREVAKLLDEADRIIIKTKGKTAANI